MYKVQLNAYALIGERSGIFNPVEKLLLVYYEPFGGLLEADQLKEVLREDGFNMPFSAHLKEIDLRPEVVVKPLLAEVRRYAQMDTAPAGKDGCPDCGILEQIAGWQG